MVVNSWFIEDKSDLINSLISLNASVAVLLSFTFVEFRALTSSIIWCFNKFIAIVDSSEFYKNFLIYDTKA